MITIVRPLSLRLKEWTVSNGKGPENVKPGIFYPVLGYSVGMRKVKKNPEAVNQQDRSFEDIQKLYFLNDRGELCNIFPSYCELRIESSIENLNP